MADGCGGCIRVAGAGGSGSVWDLPDDVPDLPGSFDGGIPRTHEDGSSGSRSRRRLDPDRYCGGVVVVVFGGVVVGVFFCCCSFNNC